MADLGRLYTMSILHINQWINMGDQCLLHPILTHRIITIQGPSNTSTRRMATHNIPMDSRTVRLQVVYNTFRMEVLRHRVVLGMDETAARGLAQATWRWTMRDTITIKSDTSLYPTIQFLGKGGTGVLQIRILAVNSRGRESASSSIGINESEKYNNSSTGNKGNGNSTSFIGNNSGNANINRTVVADNAGQFHPVQLSTV
jgi:hypothetical protein